MVKFLGFCVRHNIRQPKMQASIDVRVRLYTRSFARAVRRESGRHRIRYRPSIKEAKRLFASKDNVAIEIPSLDIPNEAY